MTFNDLNIDITKMNLIPEGIYTAKIESYEKKDTKNNDGKYFSIKLKITGPQRIGAVIFHNITLESISAGAVYYGSRQLSQLLESVGLNYRENPNLDDLINKEVEITITHKSSEAFGTQVSVTSYRKVEQSMAEPKEYIPF